MKGGPLSSDQSQTWKSHVTNITVGHETVDVTEAGSTQRAVGESEKAGHKQGMLSVILCMCASNSTGQDRNVIFTTFLLIVR
jgi:hypothetical protein